MAGDRARIGRAITLVESTAPKHRADASRLLAQLMPHTGSGIRVGITGVPGVGKSTFIDALGSQLIAEGHRVAVVAVDPSSTVSGGSILGDKTRMARLSVDPAAFVRPSPTAGTLGGVASKSREAMLVLEAAGYDIVLVETVGVGQSELVVADMTDVFVVLMLAGAGDELQGIKRGLMELADILVVHKADGDNLPVARRAAATYRSALKLLRPTESVWTPRVLCASAKEESGIDAIWDSVGDHRDTLRAAGRWEARRREQAVRWMWTMVDEGLRSALRLDPSVRAVLDATVRDVLEGELAPTRAADALLQTFRSDRADDE